MKSEEAIGYINEFKTFAMMNGWDEDFSKAAMLAVNALRGQAKYEEALRMACDELAALTTTQYNLDKNVISLAYQGRFEERAGILEEIQ